jgi:hypothetical protein
MNESVLGFLATRFSSSQENLATEALNYLLGKSDHLRNGFLEFINQAGCEIGGPLTFSTQSAGEDNAIPDLVGVNNDGKKVVVGEAKFWAGLTENQPLTYVKHLPSNEKSILLFIAPARRFQTLWPEIKRRCTDADIVLSDERTMGKEFLATRINDNQHLALCSWRSLLNTLSITANTHALHNITADIQQLDGLCSRMDSEAFLPIQSTELSSGHGLRYLHYHQIVDEVVEKLVTENIVVLKGVRATPAWGRYTRYMKKKEDHDTERYAIALQFHGPNWSKIRETPIWLRLWEIVDSDWINSPSLRNQLHSLKLLNPPKVIEYDDRVLVPLYIPVGKEKDNVELSLFNQVVEVINLLG